MTTPPPPPPSWEAVLDRLEADLARVRAGLADGGVGGVGEVGDTGGWQPPSPVVDLPPELRARALALAAAQEQVAALIARAMVATRDLAHRTTREQALAHQVQAATSPASSPVYLDIVT